jgi:hypothetical protein
MSIDDYSENFTKLEICHLGPEYDDGKTARKCWERRMERGSWKKNVSAGGCHNNKGLFRTIVYELRNKLQLCAIIFRALRNSIQHMKRRIAYVLSRPISVSLENAEKDL